MNEKTQTVKASSDANQSAEDFIKLPLIVSCDAFAFNLRDVTAVVPHNTGITLKDASGFPLCKIELKDVNSRKNVMKRLVSLFKKCVKGEQITDEELDLSSIYQA